MANVTLTPLLPPLIRCHLVLSCTGPTEERSIPEISCRERYLSYIFLGEGRKEEGYIVSCRCQSNALLENMGRGRRGGNKEGGGGKCVSPGRSTLPRPNAIYAISILYCTISDVCARARLFALLLLGIVIGPIPPQLGSLVNLQELNLSANKLTGE